MDIRVSLILTTRTKSGNPFTGFQQFKRIDPVVAVQPFSQFKIAMVRRMDSEDAETLIYVKAPSVSFG